MLERLEIGQQKFVLGRWLGHEGLDKCRRWCARDPTKRQLRADAATLLDALTRGTLADKRSPESVEAFLTRLPSELERSLTASTATQRLLAAIAERVERHLEGPVDPFRRAFDLAAQASARLCGAPAECAARPLEIYIARSGRLHDLPVSIQVAGKLVGAESGGTVELHLTADSFRAAEAHAVPYALFHEFVVHGHASAAAREDVGSFAEGWMDAVAFDVHTTAVRREPPLADLDVDLPFEREATFRAGERFHLARHHSDGAIDGSAEMRTVGWQSALITLDATQRLGHPRQDFWALSMAFNRGALPPYLRDEACEAAAIVLEAESDSGQLLDELHRTLIDSSAAEPSQRANLADAFFRVALDAAADHV